MNFLKILHNNICRSLLKQSGDHTSSKHKHYTNETETITYPFHNSGRNKAVGEEHHTRDSSLDSFSLSLSLFLSLSLSPSLSLQLWFHCCVVWKLVLNPPRSDPNPTPKIWDWPLLLTTASEFHWSWITFAGFHTLLMHFTIPSLPFVQVCCYSLFLSFLLPQTQTCHSYHSGFSFCVAVYHHRPPHPAPLLISRRIGQDNYASGDDPIIQNKEICLLCLLLLIFTLLKNLGCVWFLFGFSFRNASKEYCPYNSLEMRKHHRVLVFKAFVSMMIFKI